MQLEGVDLVLAVGAGLDRAGGADQVPRPGKRVGTQADADVDRGQSRQRDPLRVADDEVRVAVAVGIDPLDIDDPPDGDATSGMPVRAMRGLDRLRSTANAETAKTLAVYGFLRPRRLLRRGGGFGLGSAAGQEERRGYRAEERYSQPAPSESESRP